MVSFSAPIDISTIDTRRFIYNESPTNLKRFRRAIANARAGLGNVNIACPGDSRTVGAGAGTGGTNLVNGCRARGWPARLASILSGQLNPLPINSDPSWGDGNTPSALNLVDTRWTLGTGWASAGVLTLGGNVVSNGTTLNAISYAPTASFDRIDVWYIRGNGNAQVTVNVDGGATLATIDTGIVGPTQFMKTTVNCVLGTHTINIARNGTGGTMYLAGVVPWNSAQSAVFVHNMGIYGATTANWTANGNPWDPLAAATTFAADVYIFEISGNDQQQGTTVAAAQANLQSFITALKPTSDIILASPGGLNPTWSSAANQQAYAQMMYNLAISNNCVFVDGMSRFVDYNTANGLGWMYDSAHLTNAGYPELAAGYAKILAVV